MADPFSIAGSAVGVVSLGITVCQGLVEFYISVRDGLEDIKLLLKSLDGVIRALNGLSNTMKDGSSDSAAKSQVESCIADCSDAVQHLARELEMVRREALSGAGNKLSVKARLAAGTRTRTGSA